MGSLTEAPDDCDMCRMRRVDLVRSLVRKLGDDNVVVVSLWIQPSVCATLERRNLCYLLGHRIEPRCQRSGGGWLVDVVLELEHHDVTQHDAEEGERPEHARRPRVYGCS